MISLEMHLSTVMVSETAWATPFLSMEALETLTTSSKPWELTPRWTYKTRKTDAHPVSSFFPLFFDEI